MPGTTFPDLPSVARHLRAELDTNRFVLIYGYNGTGKTRLSGAFKDLGRRVGEDGEIADRDTLYFNAFTEDLFSWDNDLKNDRERVLRVNGQSHFLDGLRDLEMDNRIRPLLSRYADFDFRVDPDEWEVTFAREVRELQDDGTYRTRREEDIKLSRAEENIFIWCFFLAVAQAALGGIETYGWVKYIYIDDPVSSLDENNAIIVANHLVQLYREADALKVGTVVSTHDHLFFNVLHYELKNHFRGKASQYVLERERSTGRYVLRPQQGDTPAFHHVAALVELEKVARGEAIHTHHFNMLRAVLEKTALFLGYTHFGVCIKRDPTDADGILHQRFVDLLSHGKYSLYEPVEMGEDTKRYFRRIVREFLERFPYNKALFPTESLPETDATS